KLERKMMQALVVGLILAADECQAMMIAITAQEYHAARHHRAGIDIRHLEAQHLGIKPARALEIGNENDRVPNLPDGKRRDHDATLRATFPLNRRPSCRQSCTRGKLNGESAQ